MIMTCNFSVIRWKIRFIVIPKPRPRIDFKIRNNIHEWPTPIFIPIPIPASLFKVVTALNPPAQKILIKSTAPCFLFIPLSSYRNNGTLSRYNIGNGVRQLIPGQYSILHQIKRILFLIDMRRAGIPDTRLDFVANRCPHLLSGIFRLERNAWFVSNLPDTACFRISLDIHVDHGTGFASLTGRSGIVHIHGQWTGVFFAIRIVVGLTEPDCTNDGTKAKIQRNG